MAKHSQYEKYIDLTNGRTRYFEAGDSDHHVIMLHGIGILSSANSYRWILEEMAKKYHCYAIDGLGWGLGTREIAGGEGPTFHMVIDHMREFMDAKGIEKASVIGHSAGGWITALLAYESPHLVNKLVMLGSAGWNTTVAFGIQMRSLPAPAQIETITRGRFANWKTTPPEPEFREFLEEIQQVADQPGALHSLDPLLHQMHTPEMRNHFLLHRRAAHIKVPTLIIWGEADYQEPWPTWTREYEALNGDMSKSSKPCLIPGAKFLLMPTGHQIHWEMPKESFKAISEFLDS